MQSSYSQFGGLTYSSSKFSRLTCNFPQWGLRWPGFDRHLETGTGFPEEVSDGYTQTVHAGVYTRGRAVARRGSRPASELACEWGIRRNQLYQWQREFQARGAGAFPGSGARKERTTEITRLKRELARVTEERDIVKNAAAYFATDVR